MKRRRVLGLVLTVVAVMFAGEPAADAGTGPGFDARTDLAYAPAQPAGSRGHLLDLYLPRSGGRSRPLLVAMGGSGWHGDDGKAYAAQLAPFFTGAGYVVAGVSTRSSSQAVFPAQLHDVKAAIRWLRAHATTYGIDPGRIAVLGDSSGGWTAAMAGVTGHVAALEGDVGVTGPPSDVQAVVDLYGPTDFLRMDAHMRPGACDTFNRSFGLTDCHSDPRSPESALLGRPIRTVPDRVEQANPITYVTGRAPAFLIAHGELDGLVPTRQSEMLFDALAAAGVPATYYLVPGAGHDKRIVSPANRPAIVRRTAGAGPAGTRPTLTTIEEFLRRTLGPAPAPA
ncbi:alpha/beta hydrolase [Paractinoplanes ferrugineus]|uniref:alpha/beta hydrolase n=1 Tax=Paractinoplanes ferrugineus TaxID=113564 RepID=UPI00194316F9|nr:alpha/beta hydrolase [Actinoplanes ferrugineus]